MSAHANQIKIITTRRGGVFHPQGQAESIQNVEVLGNSLSPFCLFILLQNYISEVYSVHYTPLHVSTAGNIWTELNCAFILNHLL